MPVIELENSSGRKFQALADELNKYSQIIAQGEAQFGILGLVTRVEAMLKSIMESKLGVFVKFINDKSSGYVNNIVVSGTIKPTFILKRKLSLDIINSAKKGDVRPVIASLKNEVSSAAKKVRNGEDPFSESVKQGYVVFECDAAPGVTDATGTLASFKGVLPVEKVSLVDTDKEICYIPKEVKKNHFILKPTKEQLRTAIVNALYSSGISENELRRYLQIARTGNIRIIKEEIAETANIQYKRFGQKITVSDIRYK